MIYLELFWEFFKIGLFSFGGAYGAIPLIQESILARGWIDSVKLSQIIAVSESTPGPIMVNTATYIGKVQGSALGAFLATLAVVLPSFLVTLLILIVFHKWFRSPRVQAILNGIKPTVIAVILATGITMSITALRSGTNGLDLVSLLIAAVLLFSSWVYKRKKRGSISPLLLLAFSAILGILLY